MVKKKKKDAFTQFRSHELPAYKTFKIPLKTILCQRHDVQPVLNQWVIDINDVVIHTYQFIRLYVIHLFHHQLTLPVIDETFVLYCIRTLGVRDNRGRQSANTQLLENLQEFYKQEYQPLLHHEKTDLKHTTHITPYVATQITTCIATNLQEHFLQHLLRFINKTTRDITEDKATLHTFKHQLCMWKDTDPVFDDWKATHVPHIFPTNIKNNVLYDVKVRPLAYLPGMLYMNAWLENDGHKLFQPLPLRSNIVPKSLLLDTAAIVSLFCPETDQNGNKVKKGELLKHIKDNQHEVWNAFVNLQHRIFKNKHYQFHYQMHTDGVSCGLLFIRKDLKDKKWGSRVPTLPDQEFWNIEDVTKDQLDALKPRNIVGCDPGKRNLVYMVDESGKKLQYTAPQRRRESKHKCHQRILLQERTKNGIVDKETVLSCYNSKSVQPERFKAYLVAKQTLNQETQAFYQREVWRKMKFRVYSYGKKSMDTFLNNIKTTFGDNILIGYGNWSRSTQMKHFMPTMNKGLRKLIHKTYDTITVNECNTSKKCCGCLQDLQHYKTKDNKEVFRLLVCSECVSCENKHTVFRTRDVNSAVNIRRITRTWIETQKRDPAFQISSFTRSAKAEREKVRPS